MRKKIAEHMVLSKRTSAHVHSVFHVDFSDVERIRQQKKEEYAGLGAKLTYMAFIAKAVIDALRRHPIVNASLDGDNVVYKKDVNLGIAVALESGLIVPVIKNADEKNLLGLSRAIADVAERARAKQLKPEEVHGGTFTITNPGQFGAQFGMPIINQPQVAILGVGTVEKRPVVVDDGDRDPDDGVPDARLRSPADRRRGGGSVHGRHQAAPRALRRRTRCSAAQSKSAGSASSPTATRWPCSARSSRSAARTAYRTLLLLLQHPPVITVGVKGDGGRSNVVADPRQLATARHRDFRNRPRRRRHLSRSGQIVGYPILDLRPDRCDVHRYVRDLEEVMIRRVRRLRH